MEISRRQGLALGTSAALAMVAAHSDAEPAETATAAGPFSLESDSADAKELAELHGGKGVVKARRFGFSGAAAPTNFVSYDIPPGASEGVHVHGIGLKTGPYDEYYYIASGTGVMQIDEETVPVKTGDHVHTPMGVHHGIENTAATGNLKVLVTFITKT